MIDPTLSRYRYMRFQGGRYRRFVDGENEVILGKQEPDQPEISNHGTYGAWLFHPLWKARRAQILQRDTNSCVICQSNEKLQVHHRQYHFSVRSNNFKKPWEYDDHLLITLCEPCHKKGHSKFKVPTINV